MEIEWDDLNPVEPWEDIAPEELPALESTNNWDEGVEWPEETAPAPDDSFGTLTSCPSPEQVKRTSFGDAEKSHDVKESKKEQKAKKKASESPNKENKKEKKEKQAKGAAVMSDAPEEGGYKSFLKNISGDALRFKNQLLSCARPQAAGCKPL